MLTLSPLSLGTTFGKLSTSLKTFHGRGLIRSSRCHYSEEAKSNLRRVPMYDFNRYMRVYNHNKPLRFPIDDMEVAYFVRPDAHDDDEMVMREQLSQERFPMSEISSLLPVYIKHGTERFSSVADIRTEDETLHSDATFLGFHRPDPDDSKIERYLLKFFRAEERQLKNARREVLFSYLCVEAGQALHAPKITLNRIDGHACVIRRFYKGTDGRFILDNEIPEDLLQQLQAHSLVKGYALRYALLGDIDFHNPGNIIFTRHSDLTPKVLLHIDGEGILPDQDSMSQFVDTDHFDPNAPVPGSTAWRLECVDNLGADEFFRRMCLSENSLLAFLRQMHSVEEMRDLQVPPEFVERLLTARPYFEQLVRTFDVVPLEVLQKGEADFQRILDHWEAYHREQKPLTLFHLVTALY